MALRKFRSFIQDRLKGASMQSQGTILKQDADDADITDAAAVIVGDELSVLERQSLTDRVYENDE